MVPESVTVKHHASRAGHGPGAGGHKGGTIDVIIWQTGTARLLPHLLNG